MNRRRRLVLAHVIRLHFERVVEQHRHIGVLGPRQDYDGSLFSVATQPLDDLNPVPIGKGEVEDDRVILVDHRQHPTVLCGRGRVDRVPVLLEQPAHEQGQRCVIVYDQSTHGGGG